MRYTVKIMADENGTLFGCLTSRKHEIGIFKLHCPWADEGEDITRLKTRQRIVAYFDTKNMATMPEMKTRIEKSNIYVCEGHFKPE